MKSFLIIDETNHAAVARIIAATPDAAARRMEAWFDDEPHRPTDGVFLIADPAALPVLLVPPEPALSRAGYGQMVCPVCGASATCFNCRDSHANH